MPEPSSDQPARRPRSKQKRVVKRLTATVPWGDARKPLVVTLDLERNEVRLRPHRCRHEKVYAVVDLYHWGPQLSLALDDAVAAG